MSTPESKVKRAIDKVLGHYLESYVFKSVPFGYGPSTLDYLVCHYGRFISVEAKRPGGRPTDRQEMIIALVKRAGGAHFTVSNNDELALLEAYLEQVKQNATSTSQSSPPHGRRSDNTDHNKPLSRREAVELWRRPPLVTSPPANGNLPPPKDGV